MSSVQDKSLKYGLFAILLCGSGAGGHWLWKLSQSRHEKPSQDPVSRSFREMTSLLRSKYAND